MKKALAFLAFVVCLACLLFLLFGCSTNANKIVIIKHPDSPMLIQEVDGSRVKVAIYNEIENRLIQYGWIEIPIGWTIHKFNWESFIKGEIVE